CHDPKLRRLAPLAAAAGNVALPGARDRIFCVCEREHGAELYALPRPGVYAATGGVDIRVRNVDRPHRTGVRIQDSVLANLPSGQGIDDSPVAVGCMDA